MNKVELVDEIKNRLIAAQSSGLAGVKAVRVATLHEARQQANMPFINIRVVSGEETPQYQQRGYTDEMIIEVRLIYSKLAAQSSGNQLYDLSSSKGALFMLENILNALDVDESGNVDLLFNGKAVAPVRRTYDFLDDSDLWYEVVVRLEIQTKYFRSGSR